MHFKIKMERKHTTRSRTPINTSERVGKPININQQPHLPAVPSPTSSSLFWDRSISSSKASSTDSAILCFLFQFPISSRFRNSHPVVAYIIFLVFPSLLNFPISFLQLRVSEAAPKQDVTNPFTLSSFLCVYDIPLLFDSLQYFFTFHTISTTDLLQPSPALNFKTFQELPIYSLKCRSFSTTQSYSPNLALHWYLP
jgi:hypothetical protein